MQYFIVFAGFFAMSALLMATFYWLPKGQAAHDKFIFKCGVNFTAILRGNSKWKHVIYWGVPVLVLLFSNFLGGLAMLAAAFIGLTSSEERRGGKECVSTCRSRWSPDHS